MKTLHDKEKRTNVWAYALALAMLLIAVASFAPGAQAQVNPPLSVTGYVLDANGDPVANASVTLVSGTTTGTNVTNETGVFLIDADEVDDGDTIYLFAINGTETGSTSFEADRDTQADPQNITLGTLGDIFMVTFFAYNEDGDGVENVTIQVSLGGVIVENLTTNETGIAQAFVIPGLYDWEADVSLTGLTGLNDRTGDFTILDDNKVVLIDLSVAERIQSILGFGISDECLGIVAILIVVGLIALLAVHSNGMRGNKKDSGALTVGQIVLIGGLIVLALLVLGGYTLSTFTSVEGILDFFGMTYGVISAVTDDVVVFLLVMSIMIAGFLAAFNALAAAGAFDERKALYLTLLVAGLDCWTYLLAPGFPQISEYTFFAGLIMLVALVVGHIKPEWFPKGGSAATVAIVLSVALEALAVLCLYGIINGASPLVLAALAFAPGAAGGAYAFKKDNAGKSSIFNVPGKSHVAVACLIASFVLLALSVVGAVKVAFEPSWMVISFGILDSYHTYTVGALVVFGFVCLVALAAKTAGKGTLIPSKAWCVFGWVASWVLAGALYLYWFKVLDYLGLASIPSMFVFALANPGLAATIGLLAVVAAVAIGLARITSRKNVAAPPSRPIMLKNERMDGNGKATVGSIGVFAAGVMGVPIAFFWANAQYGITDGTGYVFKWVLVVLYGFFVYGLAYLTGVNQK